MNPSQLFTRHAGNPILGADAWPVPVHSVFNPAACATADGTVLICRVEDTAGLSHLWVARSSDGIGDWRVDPSPLLSPHDEIDQWGVEDPRVVYVPELDRHVLTCTAYGPQGPAVYLTTTDFTTVEDPRLIMPPEDKNAALFSRRIGDQWVLLHRPAAVRTRPKAEIWLSRSRDLEAWRKPELVLRTRDGAWWDSLRIGTGPPPLETDDGWLLIYHGVRGTVGGALYRVGLALLDLDDPARVLRRADDHVLTPSEPYERVGDVPNVVFPCGAVHDPATDELRLYYGAADTTVALATARLGDVLEHLRSCPAPDPR